MLPNVAVIANRMKFEEGLDGRLLGFQDPLLTSVRSHLLCCSIASQPRTSHVPPSHVPPGQQEHLVAAFGRWLAGVVCGAASAAGCV